MDSQDFGEAHWVGSCGLPKAEQMEYMRRQLNSNDAAM